MKITILLAVFLGSASLFAQDKIVTGRAYSVSDAVQNAKALCRDWASKSNVNLHGIDLFGSRENGIIYYVDAECHASDIRD